MLEFLAIMRSAPICRCRSVIDRLPRGWPPALGIVLMRLRIAKIHEHTVAQIFCYVAEEAAHGLFGVGVERRDIRRRYTSAALR